MNRRLETEVDEETVSGAGSAQRFLNQTPPFKSPKQQKSLMEVFIDDENQLLDTKKTIGIEEGPLNSQKITKSKALPLIKPPLQKDKKVLFNLKD